MNIGLSVSHSAFQVKYTTGLTTYLPLVHPEGKLIFYAAKNTTLITQIQDLEASQPPNQQKLGKSKLENYWDKQLVLLPFSNITTTKPHRIFFRCLEKHNGGRER